MLSINIRNSLNLYNVVRCISQSTKIKRDVDSSQETSSSSYIYDDQVIAKIGLEVHAQMKLKSKLFSQGSTEDGSPNTKLDLLDVALPGVLPVLNKEALKAGILSSLALNSDVQECSHFDRKNYFYSDMPAGYQITQKDRPLARNGHVDFVVTAHHHNVISHGLPYDLVKYLYFEERKSPDGLVPYTKRSHIRQIQLEQDSAKSLHQVANESSEPEFTLVDYNRCGATLIEIVFEPDLSSHHEASSLVRDLTYILKSVGTCDCELQNGSLRVDANVSIHSLGGQVIENSQRVELKNLNSMGFLNRGILFEISRQASMIKQGQQVQQETRHYDYRTGKTIPLRLKEDTVDYRYVPEPNIPPIKLERSFVDSIREKLPRKLPSEVMRWLIDTYNLDLALMTGLFKVPGLTEYFEQVMDGKYYDPDVICDFLIYNISRLKNVLGSPIKVNFDEGSDFMKVLSPKKMQEICDMMTSEEISYTSAHEVIKYLFTGYAEDPRQLVTDLGLQQINDDAEVKAKCMETISLMKNIPKQYRKKGKKKDLRMIIDKVLQSTDNRINVRKAIEYIEDTRSSYIKSQEEKPERSD